MSITSTKAKACTFVIGTTSYTAWITNATPSGEKSSETVSTWGEDVAYTGSPSYSMDVDFLFDPTNASLGKALESAFASNTAISIAMGVGTATRAFTTWQVTSYSEEMPADGLVSGKAGLIGSSMWTTTYTG